MGARKQNCEVMEKNNKFSSKFVFRVYITLDGIGDLEGKNISCDFQEESFDLKVKDYRKQNLRFIII